MCSVHRPIHIFEATRGVGDYINTIKTIFYLSFGPLQAFFELQVYKKSKKLLVLSDSVSDIG